MKSPDIKEERRSYYFVVEQSFTPDLLLHIRKELKSFFVDVGGVTTEQQGDLDVFEFSKPVDKSKLEKLLTLFFSKR